MAGEITIALVIGKYDNDIRLSRKSDRTSAYARCYGRLNEFLHAFKIARSIGALLNKHGWFLNKISPNLILK